MRRGASVSVIPVFVASTFRDFHQERDLLRRRIAQQLTDEVAGLGCRVEFVDLRWGATDSGLPEDEREAQILAVCAREIDRSRPIMLGLIGSSYGRPFSRERLSADELARLPDKVQQRVGDISVTEYELLYGLHASEATEVILLARKIQGTVDGSWRENESAASDLQRRLRGSDRVTLRPYEARIAEDGVLDLEDFEREVVKALRSRVRRRASELTSGDPYRDAERLLLAECANPVGLDDVRAEVIARLREGRTVVVASPRVVGKTALFASVIDLLRTEGAKVASASVGIGPVHTLGALVAVLLRQLVPDATEVNFVESAVEYASILDDDFDPDAPAEFLTAEMRVERRRIGAVALGKLIAGYAQQHGYTCVAVDGIDRLSGSHEDRALAWALLQPVRDAKDLGLLFLTDVDRSGDETQVIEVPKLSPDAAALMLEQLVHRSGRVGVPAEVLELLRRRDRSPLWVSTVYDLIDGLGGAELLISLGVDWAAELDRVLVSAVASLPEDDEGAVLSAVDRIAEEDGSGSHGITRRFVEVLALAHGGLTAQVISEVLDVGRSHVATIRYRLGSLVVESGLDRVVRISHPSVRRLLASRIAPSRSTEIHHRIAGVLLELCGTHSEAVALCRHGLAAQDAVLATAALNRAVEVMGRLDVTARSMGVDLAGIYFELAVKAPVLVDVEGLSPPALAVMVDAVLRRLDTGFSAAPSDDEWPFLDALVDRVEREALSGEFEPRRVAIDLLNQVAMRYFRIAPLRKDLHGASDRYWRTLEVAKRELDDSDATDLGALWRFAGHLSLVLTGAWGYIDPARRDRLVDEFLAVQAQLEERVALAQASEEEPELSYLLYIAAMWRGSCLTLAQLLEGVEDAGPAATRVAGLVERSGAFASSLGSDRDFDEVEDWAIERLRAGLTGYADRADRLPDSFFPPSGTEWDEPEESR